MPPATGGTSITGSSAHAPYHLSAGCLKRYNQPVRKRDSLDFSLPLIPRGACISGCADSLVALRGRLHVEKCRLATLSLAELMMANFGKPKVCK